MEEEVARLREENAALRAENAALRGEDGEGVTLDGAPFCMGRGQ